MALLDPTPCSNPGNEEVRATWRGQGKGQRVHAKPPEDNDRKNTMGNISEEYEGVVRAGKEYRSFLSGKGTAISEEKH